MRKLACLLALFLLWSNPAIAQEKPTWRLLWLIMPNINATLDDGTSFKMSMTAADIEKVTLQATLFKQSIEKGTNHQVNFIVDVFVSKQEVTSLQKWGDGYWIASSNMPADAQDKAAQYDMVIATTRLAGEQNTISPGWWGLGGDKYCLVQMLEGYDLWYLDVTSQNPHPEEIWIHEWEL